jgi:hypothetical protein
VGHGLVKPKSNSFVPDLVSMTLSGCSSRGVMPLQQIKLIVDLQGHGRREKVLALSELLRSGRMLLMPFRRLFVCMGQL